MSKPPSAPLIAILLAVVVLFGSYVGAYYAQFEGIRWAQTEEGEWTLRPHYRVDALGPFFSPAHKIDCMIRVKGDPNGENTIH